MAAHLIGQVGPIYAEEYEELKEKGYALNDKVGKGGIEAAMEDSLRGTTGTRTLVKDAKGNVLEEKETKAPVPGKSVVLTIDTDLQAKVQQILKAKFEELRAKPATKGGKFADNGHDVKSGSVVMLDVSDGGVLVCASWPSFDLATYGENYAELVKDPDKPLFNRALNGAFPFGSTAKPAVALAAFSKNELTPSTHITCDRRYRYYEDYQPTCMGRHGSIDVATALSKSCNVFSMIPADAPVLTRLTSFSTCLACAKRPVWKLGSLRAIWTARRPKRTEVTSGPAAIPSGPPSARPVT